MLNEEMLLLALNDVSDRQLEETRRRLGYGERGKTKVRPRRLGRVLALAAALSLLLITTAYAAYRVSLNALRAGEYLGAPMSSLAGTMDSPEGQALRDWLKVLDSETAVYDYATAAALGEGYESYGAYTPEMADTLDGILERYGLEKDGSMTVAEDERSFCEAARVGRLTQKTDKVENVFLAGFSYPSGAFHMEGDLYPAGEDYGVGYQLVRSVRGVFSMAMTNLGDVASYEEWGYETPDGQSLTLARNTENGGAVVLAQTEDGFAALLLNPEVWIDHIGDDRIDGIGDEFRRLDFTKEQVESLAGGIRWAALTDPTLGMDEDFSVPDFEPTGSLLDLVDRDLDLAALPESDQYYISTAYETQIAPYIEDFRLVDYEVESWGNAGTTGWIAFNGTPKGELDWAKIETAAGEVYCRSLCLLPDGEGGFDPGPSFDMLPYPYLSAYRDVGENGEEDVVYLGHELKALDSAALYVQQLGETFTLSGERLDELTKLLEYGHLSAVGVRETWNPLYLNFSDGTHAVVYTAADGSDSVNLYGKWCGYGYGKSVFELFGVPLEAAGYVKHDGLVTAYLGETDLGHVISTFEVDFIEDGPMVERRVSDVNLRGRTWEYDAEGRCVRDYWWEDSRDNVARDTSYTYREDGKLAEVYSDGFSRGWERTVYEYDEQGRLTAERHSDNDDAPGWTGGNIYYDYDAEGNCRIRRGWMEG